MSEGRGHLRAVPDDAVAVEPLDEIREGVEVLARLSSNPLLSTFGLRAVASCLGLLRRYLPEVRSQ